ncbi:MAG TPA: tRNA pseudouridine(13) synthase TruD [Candidatus Bathyarchaeia archaeon]|nr:tRNA pseudouridine(13) synthase TruD [Candidatus Bathyarchaeia archaeon]
MKNLLVPKIDQQMGIEVYLTETQGVGGAIRQNVDDFTVEEVLVDGSKASLEETAKKPVLGATALRQRFLLCILVKWNWDTFIAVKNVAKQLGIDQERISIAGIKDAKAVTAQHITIEGVSVEEALKVHVKDVELRPIGYFHEQLSSYFLLGNHFGIRIKSLSHPKATVEKRIAKIAEEIAAIRGIPNFYGHQRFGTTRAITHLVGKAMVKGNLEEAAMLFLAKPSPHEHPESRQARSELQTRQDFKQALHDFPVQLRFERIMLAHLVEEPGDFAGAFRQLPLKLRMLFVQAYQSFLFNRFLSERIKSGLSLGKAEIGDYVVNIERSGLPITRTGKVVSSADVAETNRLIKAGKMRLALPIVGTKQKLSQGALGEIERHIMESEGVDPENFRIAELPEISGRGELRAAVSPVRDFSAEAVSTDAKEPKKHQKKLEFTLLRGSYATVLLREIMKSRDPINAGF